MAPSWPKVSDLGRICVLLASIASDCAEAQVGMYISDGRPLAGWYKRLDDCLSEGEQQLRQTLERA
jgi:hypothetical protein